MRRVPFHGLGSIAGRQTLEPIAPPEILENRIAAQAAEVKQLAGDNHRLAATHVALREDLAVSQQEIQQLKAYIRSIQTESDIQIRVLLDKITKKEVEIRAGEGVKNDLEQAHKEAESLVAARQELSVQIQQASQELQRVRVDVKKLPELQAELDSLRKEHRKLRALFEYEKRQNIEQVEHLQAMEKNLLSMVKEVEKLQAEVFNAEKRANVPYSGGYMNPKFSYPPQMPGSATYVDSYGRPYVQTNWPSGETMVSYGNSNTMIAVPTPYPTSGVVSDPTNLAAAIPTSGNAVVSTSGTVDGGETYDPAHTQG
ncbi:hypothetical protein UlMin_045831 [Ulmus minor]